MQALLVGYYGKGNFGDDLLLKVTHAIVRKHLPDAEIAIFCDTYDEDYLATLIGERSRILRPGDREHFDLIVHGGGGTFFDYEQYGIGDRLLNSLIRLVGFRAYATFDRVLRAALGKKRLSTDRRLGWGIGIGTYAPGSRKLRHNVPALLDFHCLAVRDATSLQNLRAMGVTANAVLGSDLAFLNEYWVPEKLSDMRSESLHRRDRPKLGLVLRDWPSSAAIGYLAPIVEALPELSHRFDLSFFVFDRRADPQVIALSEGYVTHIWSPTSMRFQEYCELLAQQDVIVTSRAHGAMCAAVLGIPSLIIEVEPKLRTIHEMLPEATRVVKPDTPYLWLLVINELLSVKPNAIASDVARNRTLIEKAIDQSLS